MIQALYLITSGEINHDSRAAKSIILSAAVWLPGTASLP